MTRPDQKKKKKKQTYLIPINLDKLEREHTPWDKRLSS